MKTNNNYKKDKGILVCLYIYSAILVISLVFSFLNNFDHLKHNKTTSLYRDEVNFDEYLDDILLLEEDVFETLNDEEKLRVLQTLVYIENTKAGIKTCPKIKLSDRLSDSVAGCYEPSKGVILINNDVFHSSCSQTLATIVLHEFHHHLAHELASAYRSLPARYQNLEAFCVYREFAYELENYIKPENDTEALYYQQSIESSARRFSEITSEEYFDFIRDYKQK